MDVHERTIASLINAPLGVTLEPCDLLIEGLEPEVDIAAEVVSLGI
jgi:hypothetical protein